MAATMGGATADVLAELLHKKAQVGAKNKEVIHFSNLFSSFVLIPYKH
jgi:hypothetical protein